MATFELFGAYLLHPLCGTSHNPTHGKDRTVDAPWAHPGSGFSLLYEALPLALIEREILVNRVAEILKAYPHRILTIFNHGISKARTADDPSTITKLETDETSTDKTIITSHGGLI